jgi:parallel beta-helix repeat protein
MKNKKFGVQIEGKETPVTFTLNVISDNMADGLVCGIGVKGLIVKNEFSENFNGIVTLSSENKIILNKLTQNKKNGIHTLTYKGILNDTTAKMNLITQNVENGILIEGVNNRSVVQSNYNVSENGKCGVKVCENACARIINNFIYYNNCQGILLQERSIAKIMLNNIFKNFKANIAIGGENSGEHMILNNVIHNSSAEGIFMIQCGKAVIYKNEIFNNYDGIVVSESCPEIRNNKIRNNTSNGILISQGSTPLIENNKIKENEVIGILVQDISEPRIFSNLLEDNEVNIGSENLKFQTNTKLEEFKGRNIFPTKEGCLIF